MRIAIDCRKLSENKTGIGNYIENIIIEILKIDQNNEYYLFYDDLPEEIFKGNNIHYVKLDKLKGFIKKEKVYKPIWLNFILPFFLRKYQIDLFWGPNFVKPLFFSAPKNIITIHDLAFLFNKDDHSRVHSLYLKYILKFTVNNNIKVLTVSEYSKQDIIKQYKISKNNVDVTHCAINHENVNTITTNQGTPLKYGIPNNYMLFVGTTEKRKNLNLILDSMSYSINKGSKILPLVVVGAKGNGLETLRELTKKLNIEQFVHFTGYVPDNDLINLYKNASIFIFPSLYEGFGIPVIEAMSYGVPVITSNVTSLPEVVGGAGLLINPHSSEELSYAINLLITDSNLRNSLVEAGLKRIDDFKWENSARVFINMINQY